MKTVSGRRFNSFEKADLQVESKKQKVLGFTDGSLKAQALPLALRFDFQFFFRAIDLAFAPGRIAWKLLGQPSHKAMVQDFSNFKFIEIDPDEH
jgi:hypothetical protein